MPKLKIKQKATLKKILIIVGILIGVALLVYFAIQGRHYFTRRSVRTTQTLLNSYGPWSPLVILVLMVLSTVIPPLPIPILLLEIAAGLMFGFWKGFFVVWISQLVSALSAYYMTKFIGEKFFKKILNNRIIVLYKRYINTKGPMAIIITRATMSAPFNIVSFLAGISQMSVWVFSGATLIGTLPEVILYTTIGVILKTNRFRLLYVFIFSVIISLIGPVISYFMIRYIQPKKRAKIYTNTKK